MLNDNWILVPMKSEEKKKEFLDFIFKRTGIMKSIPKQYSDGFVMLLVSFDLMAFSTVSITCGMGIKTRTRGVDDFIERYDQMLLEHKKIKVLLHMPHVSLDVPNEFYDGLLIPKWLFHKYNLEMTDLGIDELFKGYNYTKVIPKYSRLYCDVERFRDDSKEIMSKYGEGVVYTNLYDGTLFHQHDNNYRNKVLSYYDEYHKNLDNITKELLNDENTLLILDCHSFSDKMTSHFYKEPFPDICIGVEDEYYDQEILDMIINKITQLGYTYKINYPYKGSLVPNCVINKEAKGKVVSIMLEINKKIYL